MQTRLIGILILLSFLMIRNSKLLAAEAHQSLVMMEQTADEQPDKDKEPKPMEFADEDCLPAGLAFVSYGSICLKLQCNTFDPSVEVYFTLPYPPPELLS